MIWSGWSDWTAKLHHSRDRKSILSGCASEGDGLLLNWTWWSVDVNASSIVFILVQRLWLSECWLIKYLCYCYERRKLLVSLFFLFDVGLPYYEYSFLLKKSLMMNIISMGGNDLGPDQSDYYWNIFSFFISQRIWRGSLNFLSKWELDNCNNVVLSSTNFCLINKHNSVKPFYSTRKNVDSKFMQNWALFN